MNMAFANNFGQRLLNSPEILGDTVIERGRDAARAAARVIDRVKAPSHRLAEAGLRVNTVAHETVARLLRNHLQIIDGMMDEGVRRLELAAQADDLRALFAAQIELLADTRARVSDDAERTLAILADSRARLNEAFSATVAAAAAEQEAPASRAARVRKPARAQRKRATRRTKR